MMLLRMLTGAAALGVLPAQSILRTMMGLVGRCALLELVGASEGSWRQWPDTWVGDA